MKNLNLNTANLSGLERVILGNNTINSISIDQINHIYPQLLPLVGTKLFTAKEDFVKKVNIDLLNYDYIDASGFAYRRYMRKKYNSLVLCHDCTIKDKDYIGGGYGVSYYGEEVIFGTINNDGVLTKLHDLDQLIKSYSIQYNLEEQKELILLIDEKEKELRELKLKQIKF